MKSKIRNWERAKVIGVCVMLAALVWGVFGQTLRFEFINFDDVFVYETPQVTQGLTPSGIGWAFTHSEVGAWIPLTTLTHMLDCQFYGLWAGGHHFTNVVLHSAAAILLFLVLRQMTGALWRSAFVATLFAIHPLRAESVAWVIERKDVLSGIFFMLTLGAYARYARRPASRGSYAMVLVWYALGLLSKEMLVTVPFVLLLLDYWPLVRFQNAYQLPGLLKEKLPLFALSCLSCGAALLAAKKTIQPIDHIPLVARVGNALVVYVIYLEKLIHPSQLAAFYPVLKDGREAWQVIGASLLLTALTAVACVLRRKQPYLLVGWLWYLGMLVPVIGIVQVGVQAYADRFTYLPGIGLCMAGTWAAADWAGGLRHRRVAMAGVAGAALSFLLVAAYRQTSYWRDSVTLWTHTIGCTQDNGLTRFIFGDALVAHGRVEEGLYQMREALRINPNYAKAHWYLGETLIERGETGEGIAELHKALRIDPLSEEAHYSLGKALLEQGHPDEGIVELRQALTINPSDARIHNTLGIALFGKNQAQEGIEQFREALRINPDEAQAHNNLAKALIEQGQTSEAIAEAEAALRLQPANGSFQNNLAWMLATAPQSSLRDGARAVQLASQASKSSGGGDPNVLRTLAAAYAQVGKFQDAMRTAQCALQGTGSGELAGPLCRDIKFYESGHPLPDGQ